MNYLKHYLKLIRKVENREMLKEYIEAHHIFPLSIFGKNSRTVNLTYREHYIAHWLLYKGFIQRYGLKHENTIKMGLAFHRMIYSSKNKSVNNTSRIYAIARKYAVDCKLGVPRPDMIGKRWFGSRKNKNDIIKRNVEARKKTFEKNIQLFGKKTKYPTNRNSPPCDDLKREKISQKRKLTNEKYKAMSENEFIIWLENKKFFNLKGKFNTNVSRAITARGGDVKQYIEMYKNGYFTIKQ